jgi:hypothetical protein
MMRHPIHFCKSIPAVRRIQWAMENGSRKRSWATRVLRASAGEGFRRAYNEVRIDEVKYLGHLRRAYGLPVESWSQMVDLDPEVLDPIARSTISAASKMAAVEGIGLGFGGFFTVLPDMGILAAITLRLLQKLSLLHGFDYATEEEAVELWLAAASAAGVDLGRDYLEKQAFEKLAPRIVDRIAEKVGADIAEKWAGRLVPILSAAAGGAINYYFVRSWGRRAHQHFAARHFSARQRRRIALLPSGPQAWPA